MERSNDPTERRSQPHWRTPCKPRPKPAEEVFKFGSFESLCGTAGSGGADDGNNRSTTTKTATAIATPITHTSEDYSSPRAGISPGPTFRLKEEDDGHSMQWSLEPGNFVTRPITHTPPTANAVPVSPGSPGDSYISNSPPRNRPLPKPDLSLFHEDDSILMWSEDPEKAYFEYMLRLEQEHRARQGKPAEDSLLGDR